MLRTHNKKKYPSDKSDRLLRLDGSVGLSPESLVFPSQGGSASVVPTLGSRAIE